MKKVLLIEDDKITNFLSKEVLNRAGFTEVKETLNGMEALRYLEKDCPEIIFLDINMPVMDGWEFLAEREIKELCMNAKIFMLTSSGYPDDKIKASSYISVIDYFEKPLTEEKLEVVKKKIAS
ncbi:response regulator [Psychroflexus aurantiacus]|nr:response regulator [Psychroflexus aurantiacus]